MCRNLGLLTQIQDQDGEVKPWNSFGEFERIRIEGEKIFL